MSSRFSFIPLVLLLLFDKPRHSSILAPVRLSAASAGLNIFLVICLQIRHLVPNRSVRDIGAAVRAGDATHHVWCVSP